MTHAFQGKPVKSGRLRPSRAKTTKAGATPSSVIMQARIDSEFARELVEMDAPVLGISGPSELVREGLRMLHKHARELAMAQSYDAFYHGQPAPISDVTAALWAE